MTRPTAHPRGRDERGRTRDERGRTRDERGSMAVEVVLMIPILVMFALLVIAGGRLVSIRADVEAAARDAARAASFERSATDARNAARATVEDQLDPFWSCQPARMPDNFQSGGVVEVTIDCQVPVDDLGLIGLSGTVDLEISGAAPLDTYRRTG